METVTRKALAPDTRLQNGKFRIVQLIGSGGFSFVYLAQKSDGYSYAIKELFPEEATRSTFLWLWKRNKVKKTADWAELERRTRDEFELAKSVKHPNIVRVHDLFEENGTLYLVMDFLPGATLHQHLHKHLSSRSAEFTGGLSESDVVVIGQAIADGLAVAHSKGIVHRDVKPSNIMICEDGRIVLLDFGIAKNSRASDARSRVGTEAYMAPEQLKGAAQSRSVDIYGLAATLYHTLTGKTPPRAEDRLKKDTLVPPHVLAPHVSRGVSDAIMDALSLDPNDRPRTMQTFAEELRGVPKSLAMQASEHDGAWNWWKPIVILVILGALALWWQYGR
ncbi:MAG: serine/threonine-protein kinase [Fimbriiglobus sp.]